MEPHGEPQVAHQIHGWLMLRAKGESSVPDEGGCSVLPVKHTVGPVVVAVCMPHVAMTAPCGVSNNMLGEIRDTPPHNCVWLWYSHEPGDSTPKSQRTRY